MKAVVDIDRVLLERDERIDVERKRLMSLPIDVANEEIRNAMKRSAELSAARRRSRGNARLQHPQPEEKRLNLTVAAAVEMRRYV